MTQEQRTELADWIEQYMAADAQGKVSPELLESFYHWVGIAEQVAPMDEGWQLMMNTMRRRLPV